MSPAVAFGIVAGVAAAGWLAAGAVAVAAIRRYSRADDARYYRAAYTVATQELQKLLVELRLDTPEYDTVADIVTLLEHADINGDHTVPHEAI